MYSHQLVLSLCRLVSQGDILTVPAENHPDLLENNSEGIHRYKHHVLMIKQSVPMSLYSEDEGGGVSTLSCEQFQAGLVLRTWSEHGRRRSSPEAASGNRP